jgi:hypothetical protein
LDKKAPGDIGRMDRFGRVVFGAIWVLFAVMYLGTELNQAVFFWIPYCIGAYAVASGLLTRCIVYRIFGTFS